MHGHTSGGNLYPQCWLQPQLERENTLESSPTTKLQMIGDEGDYTIHADCHRRWTGISSNPWLVCSTGLCKQLGGKTYDKLATCLIG